MTTYSVRVEIVGNPGYNDSDWDRSFDPRDMPTWVLADTDTFEEANEIAERVIWDYHTRTGIHAEQLDQ